jgi:hypothetical protein
MSYFVIIMYADMLTMREPLQSNQVNTTEYILTQPNISKLDKTCGFDCLFTSAVLSGFYNFHSTAAATYATFWMVVFTVLYMRI